MSLFPVNDRSATCPHCKARNVLIGSDLDLHAPIACSTCQRVIGTYADFGTSAADAESPDAPMENCAS